MKLSLDEVIDIVRLYHEFEREDEERATEWYMDDNNCGIEYEYLTLRDICHQVMVVFNNQHN